jgi:RNA polymerase sigma factor (sigma-70 family)
VYTPNFDAMHNAAVTALSSPEDRRATPATSAERFRDVALPHLQAAYVYALRLTRHRETAEDVVQDAFMKAFVGFGSLKNEDPRPWLFRIVRHRAFDCMKRDDRRSTASLECLVAGEAPGMDDFDPSDSAQASPEDAAISNCEIAKLHRAIDALPSLLREVVMLREFEDLSYREVSQAINAPIGTVMSRLFRARARIGELLQSDGMA